MDKKSIKRFVKSVYDKINCMIDNDECDSESCSEEDIEMYQSFFFPKIYAAESAAKFLEISDYKFKLLRKQNVIPNPIKIIGLKQKFWTRSQLSKIKNSIEENN